MSVPGQRVSSLPEVVDDAIEAYVSWREACGDARDAYGRWSEAAKPERMLASCAYVAALDREEAAAGVYAEAMKRLGDEFADGPLAEPRRVWGSHAP